MKDPFNSSLNPSPAFSSPTSTFMISSSTNTNDGSTLRSRRKVSVGDHRQHTSTTTKNHNASAAQRPVVKQSWSLFLIQHQLVLSCSTILVIFAAHALIFSKVARDGHSVDWIATLTAIIPPPIWQNLSPSWTRASQGVGTILSANGSSYNPNETWSSRAMALQYQEIIVDETTGAKQVLYSKGWNDFYMVLVWVLIWTAFREAAMTYFFFPLGRYFGVGEQRKKNRNATENKDQPEGKLLRFAEQGWLFLYGGCMWTFGMYQLYHSPYWSDTTYYWRDYPKTHLDATMKWYYLVQFAFWIQQFLVAVLGIEKRRKDFLEYLIHHVITCLLIGFSYAFNLTSVGHAVLCSMDFSDVVLAVCKMLKYMHKDRVADVGFVFFVFTWAFSRHYYYGFIIWSVFVEAPKYAEMGWDPLRGLYFTPRILSGFQFLLCSLYVLLLFWLAMIIRVVIKVLKGENSEDVRSEDEDEVDDEEQEVEGAEKMEPVPGRHIGLATIPTTNGTAVRAS